MKNFWENRASKMLAGDLGCWQATCLTATEQLAEERRAKELAAILRVAEQVPLREVALELGCGTGRITSELAKIFQKVYAYDYINTFIETARNLNLPNVEFVCDGCTNFDKTIPYDCCIICGLLLHLTDEEVSCLADQLTNVPYLLVKESVGTHGRYEIRDRYSQALQCQYSATYRSPKEIESVFAESGHTLQYTSVIEHHRAETHLQVFLFKGSN